MFEKVAKNLSLLSLGIFILGYSYKQAYYNVFTIDITYYISNSEIFYTLLPLAIIILSTGNNIFNFNQRTNTNAVKVQSSSTKYRGKFKIFLSKWILNWDAFWMLVWLFALSYPIIFIKNEALMIIEPYAVLLQWISLFLLIKRDSLLELRDGNLSNGFLIILFLYFGFTCIQFGRSQGYTIKKYGNNSVKYTFKFKDTRITTGDTFFLIGETQSSLFFYSRTDSATTIFKRNEIDSLVVKNNSKSLKLF